jgi:hypothetical protein
MLLRFSDPVIFAWQGWRLCLYVYYKYGDIQGDVDQSRRAVGSQWRRTHDASFQAWAVRERIIQHFSKPLHAYALGCVMGKLLDLQKRFLFLFGSPEKWQYDEMEEVLLSKEFQ